MTDLSDEIIDALTECTTAQDALDVVLFESHPFCRFFDPERMDAGSAREVHVLTHMTWFPCPHCAPKAAREASRAAACRAKVQALPCDARRGPGSAEAEPRGPVDLLLWDEKVEELKATIERMRLEPEQDRQHRQEGYVAAVSLLRRGELPNKGSWEAVIRDAERHSKVRARSMRGPRTTQLEEQQLGPGQWNLDTPDSIAALRERRCLQGQAIYRALQTCAEEWTGKKRTTGSLRRLAVIDAMSRLSTFDARCRRKVVADDMALTVEQVDAVLAYVRAKFRRVLNASTELTKSQVISVVGGGPDRRQGGPDRRQGGPDRRQGGPDRRPGA